MKPIPTFALIAAVLALAFVSSARAAETTPGPSVTPAEARAIAKEAYIWGYPIVDCNRINYDYFVDTSNKEYKGPWNTIGHNTRLYTPEDKTIQTMNTDTLFSFAGMDVRDEPIVITVPQVEQGRYFSVHLIDLWAYPFDYIGTRATGNDGGSFMIVGPTWKGQTPKGIKKVIPMETTLGMAAFRTQLFSPDDLENAKKVQAGYKVQTLSSFLGQPAKATPLEIAKPLTVQKQKSSLEYFTLLNDLLRYAPTHPSEAAMRARFARIGIGEGTTFDPSTLSPEMRSAIQQGVADAWVDLDAALAKLNSGEVLLGEVTGTRAAVKDNYLYRAAVIVLGGPAHAKEEVVYAAVSVDSEGKPLDGANKYTIRFAPDKMPSAKAFWSLTMYDLPGRVLVANPLNRYLLNTPMKDKWVKDADGGYTFYIQHELPGKDKEANWLPAPKSPFYMFMRLYLPGKEAQDGIWKAPRPVRVQ